MGNDGVPLLLHTDDPESGGKDTRDSISDDFAYRNNVANASVQIRLAFIRKVYCLLSMQLALTVCIGAVALLVPAVQLYIAVNDWLVLLALISSFGFLFALFAYRQTHPHNLILLTCFTVVEAYSIAVIISRYDSATVLQAVALTFVVVASLTMYTFQSKRDFSSMGAGLTAGLLILIFGGFMQIFIGSTALEYLLSCGGAFIFSLFIIYDTHLLMNKLSPEEYILATINLYLDIINLFLYILRILAETSRQ